MHHKSHMAHRSQAWVECNKQEWHQAAAAGCGQAFCYGGGLAVFYCPAAVRKKIERMEEDGI